MRRYVVALVALVGMTMAFGRAAPLSATGPTTVVVSPGNLVAPTNPAGWYFWNDKNDLPTGSPGALVSGPTTPPLGAGSVELGPLTDNGATAGGHSVIATNAYFGTALADFTSMSYSTYQPGPTQAIAVQFDIRYRTTDSAYGGRLVFEPYQNGTVMVGSGWQTWSPLSGIWWATTTNAAGTGGAQVVALPAGNCAISTPCTWSQINAAFPDAQVYGRFLLKAGSGWSGFDGNADALTVGVSGNETTFDFEPSCTTDCYVRPDGDDANGGTADTPGAAKKTVQAAVNQVSPGGTVHVGAGTYVEQVDIGKQITVDGAGEGSTTIKSPASLATEFVTSGPNKPIVYVHGATGVMISHLTVDGDGQGNANNRFEGIAYYNAGGTVSHTTIVHVRETPLNGNQHGVAVYANNADATPRTLNVNNNTISDYQKNGMALNGDGLSVSVSGNNVTGAGATPLTAQNGIQVGFGAVGSVTGNTVGANSCTSVPGGCTDDPTSSATADGAAGVLVYLPGASTISVANNVLTGNQFGVWTVGATDVSITDNSISGATGNGITIFDCDVSCGSGDAVGTTGTISGNTISGQTYGLIQRDFDAGAPVPTVVAHHNNITGASTDGAWSDVALDATDNWWGSANGPLHPSNTFNVGSQGAAVSNNVLFVPWWNGAWPGGASFAPVTTTSPVGSYSSIQAGIDGSNPGGTVNAAAGTFTENVTATKSITVAGAGQASTKVVPAVSNPNPCAGSSLCGSPNAASNIVLVQANNVTLHDMTLDGDNPLVTSGISAGGSDLDARNGVVENFYAGVFNNLTVHHVTVKNIYLRGIYASSGGSGFSFHDDTVQNVQADPASIAVFNFGGSGTIANNSVSDANDAIASNWSRGTQYINNAVTASGSGVHTDNNGGSGGVADLIDGNQVSNCKPGGYGVWTFAPYVSPTVQHNTVTNCDVGMAAAGQEAAVSTSFIDNEVNGMGSATSTGVYITTSLFGFGSANVQASLTGNIIKNNAQGFLFQSEAGYTLTVNNLGNSITGNTTGTGTDGTGIYSVKMLGDWWGSASGPTNASNPSGTGDSVSNGIPFSPWLGIGTDTSVAAGFQMASPMTWVAGPAVCDGTCIQKAVDFASPGDTISVLAGTFNEQVRDAGKSNLLIDGAGMGSTFVKPSGVVANTTRINTNPAAPIFDIENATGVNIQNLTADGALNGIVGCSPDFLGFYYKKASGNLTNIAASHIELSAPLFGCQTGVGVFVEADSPDVANVHVTNAQITDYQKGGIVGNRTGTTLSVVNSTITGVGPTTQIAQNGIQVGFGATGSLSGNNISGNDYTPSTDASTGILLFQAAAATVSGNNVHDNQEGLFVEDVSGAIVTGNQFSNTRDTAIFADASPSGAYTGNTVLSQPAGVGMYIFDSSTNNQVTGNAFRNGDFGVVLDYSGAGAPSGNHLNGNCIAGSIGAGVMTSGTFVGPLVDATGNWWGAVDGANPPGSGSSIIPGDGSTIDSSGFLTSPVAGCLDPGDSDGDGLTDVQEVNVYGTDFQNPDTDGDECRDGTEVGLDPSVGGDRDPLNYWDFYDVGTNRGGPGAGDENFTLDRKVNFQDALIILDHFGHDGNDVHDHNLDRDIPNMLKPWRTSEGLPGDKVTFVDVLNVLHSFGHSC